MEYNRTNNHIQKNTCRAFERGAQRRVTEEGELLQRLINGNTPDCQGNFDNNYTEHHNDCHAERKCGDLSNVFVANVGKMACKNDNFRESVWTGEYAQMTVMSIPRCENVGIEMHEDTDQYIRVEHGTAMALVGNCADNLCNRYTLRAGEAIFVPAGVWHNIVNVGKCALKLSSVYAPPHHPRYTVQRNKL